MYICKKCLYFVKNTWNRSHHCGKSFCRVCKGYREFNHYCYITPIKEDINEKQKSKKILFIFYDFETRQDENIPGDSKSVKHVPTLCIAQITCTDCLNNSNISDNCETCGVREMIFKNDPIRELIEPFRTLLNFQEKFVSHKIQRGLMRNLFCNI